MESNVKRNKLFLITVLVLGFILVVSLIVKFNEVSTTIPVIYQMNYKDDEKDRKESCKQGLDKDIDTFIINGNYKLVKKSGIKYYLSDNYCRRFIKFKGR